MKLTDKQKAKLIDYKNKLKQLEDVYKVACAKQKETEKALNRATRLDDLASQDMYSLENKVDELKWKILELDEAEYCPDIGKKFIMYKKAKYEYKGREHRAAVVKLEVPALAARNQSNVDYDFKIRVEEAKVLEIKSIIKAHKDLNFKNIKVRSIYDYDFIYKVGATVKPTEGFDHSDGVCTGGIHGFMKRKRAVEY